MRNVAWAIRVVLVAVAITSALVLAGWALDVPALQGFGGSIDMNPATAACFVACSVALLLRAAGGRWRRRAALLLAGLVVLVGAARILGYALGAEIGIDELLTEGTSNRMALNTAIGFACIGLAVLPLNVETSGGHRLAEPAAAACAVIALLALTGHAYGVPILSQVAAHVIPMAEITALGFLALAVGVFAFRPDRGWVGVVTGRHAGGAMARLLLPLAVGAPLLLGFFTLRGQQVEVFGAAAGFATFAVACAVVLAVVVLWTARSLGRADLENARLYGEAVLERARLATVLEQLPEGVVVRDEEGRLVVYNEVARSLAKRPDGWLAMVEPDGTDMPPEQHPVRRALRDGETVRRLEAELRDEGRAIPVLVNAAPIRSPDGARAGVVAVFQDITPLKEVERLREEWNAVIAHDLRQPVNVIQLAATLLEECAEQEQDRRVAARIVAATRNLDVMIGDLLELSRLEASRLDLRKETVDLAVLARALIERSASLDSGHPLRLEVKGATEVSVDPSRIEQVLGNLLSNAAKYGQPGAEILVSVEGHPSAVEVSVTNHGPGIPPDELPRLFTRFYRARAARQGSVRGIGLGLYLCKGLIQAHGGTISVQSRPGETTTFRFTLARSGPDAALA